MLDSYIRPLRDGAKPLTTEICDATLEDDTYVRLIDPLKPELCYERHFRTSSERISDKRLRIGM